MPPSLPLLLRASLLAAVVAAPAAAQNAGPTGRLLTFDTTFGLQASDNPDLDANGSARIGAFTQFRLGLLAVTERQSFDAAIDLGLRASAGAEGEGLEPIDPALTLGYVRESRGSRLSLDASLRQSEVSELSPFDLVLDDTLSDEDLEDLLDGAGSDDAERLSFSLGATLETRRDHPFGVTYSLGVSGVRYSQDNGSFDDDTRATAGLGFRLDVTETIRATADLGYVVRDGEEDGSRLDVALTQRFAASSLGVRFGVTDQASGLRSSLALTGSHDRPTGRLNGEIGISRQDNGDLGLIGSAGAAFALSDTSDISFDLSQRIAQVDDAAGITTLRTVTSASMTYGQQLTRDWQLGLDARYVRTRTQSDGDTEDFGQVGASLSRALTPDWGLTLGANHRFETDEDGIDASATAVSLSLTRSVRLPFSRSLRRAYQPYVCLVGLLVAVEAGVWIMGLYSGSEDRARLWMVTWLGFWPGILGDWQANFRLQPFTMFASYWLIHASPGHLLGNLLVIGWFGARIGPDLRRSEMAEIWLGSVLGGAIAFGVLSQSISPMIGASGGVFGLLGAYVAIDHAERRRDRGRRAAAMRTGLLCAVILALSLVDFTLRDAVLAWQAHLGGFVTGLILSWVAGPAARAGA